MALTQEESAALMNDQIFTGRVKVCCIKYADTIMGEAPGIAAHNTRLNWARRVFQMPQQVALETTPPVVNDAQVQTDGATIADGALQVTVETVVNKQF